MRTLNHELLVRQFSCPTGLVGHLAGWIMAHRPSNVARNRWTVDLLGVHADDRVLEVGFGPGLSLAHVWQHLAQGTGTVVGLDHSDVMLAQAVRRNREAIRSGRMRLLKGNLDALPELGAPFDRVYSVNVLQFLPDRAAALQRLRESMKPGALLATTYQPRHRGARPADAVRFAEELSAAMRDAGFTAIQVETLPLRAMPVVCVLGRRPPLPDAAPQERSSRSANRARCQVLQGDTR